MMDKKYNGFNNGKDDSDGIGGKPQADFSEQTNIFWQAGYGGKSDLREVKKELDRIAEAERAIESMDSKKQMSGLVVLPEECQSKIDGECHLPIGTCRQCVEKPSEETSINNKWTVEKVKPGYYVTDGTTRFWFEMGADANQLCALLNNYHEAATKKEPNKNDQHNPG